MGLGELQPEDVDQKISAFYGALKRTWASFCTTTSIHGLKYVKDEDTNKAVRTIWFFISVIMFISAVVMVHRFYLDYRSNPTRMNVENDHAPITSIFFPAINICPDVPFNTVRARKYFETLKLPPSATVDDVIEGLSTFQGFMVSEASFKKSELVLMEEVLELNQLSLSEFIEKIRWDCNEVLIKCRLYRRIVECDKLFQVSQTFNGHCCSFNIQQTGLNFTKKFARGGMWEGLSLMVGYNVDLKDRLHSYSHGFRLLIQEHDSFPSAHANIKFITLNEESFVSIRPSETFCSDAVRAMDIDSRLCVFPEEVSLQYFPSYVSPNCELNCRVMNMIKYCGCLTYFFNLNRTTERICTFKDIPCLLQNFSDIIGRYRKTQCYCPNPCEYFEYDVQLTGAPLDLSVPTVDDFYSGIRKDFAVAHIFMNSRVYRRVRHDLLSNTVTLVSNLGSAFSLFVGMSMISAVEIFYHFTVIFHKFYSQEKKAREKILFSKKTIGEENEKF